MRLEPIAQPRPTSAGHVVGETLLFWYIIIIWSMRSPFHHANARSYIACLTFRRVTPDPRTCTTLNGTHTTPNRTSSSDLSLQTRARRSSTQSVLDRRLWCGAYVALTASTINGGPGRSNNRNASSLRRYRKEATAAHATEDRWALIGADDGRTTRRSRSPLEYLQVRGRIVN